MYNKNVKINESGRSMVEMLGVLAVMGLLTIIGIAGFKIAMNKAKANSLVADMNRLAHIVVMDKFSGYSEEAINRAVEEHNQDTEYPATCNSTFKSTMFSLTLKNPIDKEMCEQVANLGWAVPQGVFLNEVEKETLQAEDCTDSNTLTWVFMDDLSHCPDCVLSDTKCDTYGDECGSCSDLRGFTADDTQCISPDKQHCVHGSCTTCAEDYFDTGNGNCIACYTDGHHDHVQESTKYNCLGKMFWSSSGNRMIGCNDTDPNVPAWPAADEIGCKACDSRCLRGTTCYLMSAFIGFSRDKNGNCVTKCETGYFEMNDNQQCYACRNDTHYDRTAEYSKHNCLKSMFYTGDKRMVGCNDTGMANWPNSDEYSCKECDERCYDNGTCRLMGTTYGKDANGNCTTN